MNNNVTFGANFIKSVPIKKYIPENKLYTEVKANLVELDPFDIKDVHALGDIADKFGHDSYVDNIFMNAKLAFKRNKPETEDMRIYSLINHDDKFEHMDTDKVLGVAEISELEKGYAEIEYLQVHPKLVYYLNPPEYKHVGTSILNCLKEFYNKIKLHSSPSGTRFYIKNGFKAIDSENRVFIWERTNPF